MITIAGCTGVESIPAERTEAARIDLGSIRRIGVQAFSHTGQASRSNAGGEIATAIEAALREAGFEVVADASGAPVVLHGAVELFEAPVLQGGEAAERPARVRVRHHVVRADGGRAAAPPVSVTLSVEACKQAGAGWRTQLIKNIAAEVVAGLAPRRRSVAVTWESAGDLTASAGEAFRARDYLTAQQRLESARSAAQAAGESPEALAAIYFDLGVCADLLGQLDAAERSFDEALTLHGSELHIEALRAFRARRGLGGRR